MSDLMKYNAIMPRDDDSFYLWYDSLKGFRLNIIGDGNCNFNQEAEALFQIERERIIELLNKHNDSGWCGESNCPSPFPLDHLVALIKGENK